MQEEGDDVRGEADGSAAGAEAGTPASHPAAASTSTAVQRPIGNAVAGRGASGVHET